MWNIWINTFYFKENLDNQNNLLVSALSEPIELHLSSISDNIFKELKNEFPERNYNFIDGDLTKWHNNGIFLLNSALTLIESISNSHQKLWSKLWSKGKVMAKIIGFGFTLVGFRYLGSSFGWYLFWVCVSDLFAFRSH